MSDAHNTTCRRNCWALSAAVGVILAVVLVKAAAFAVGLAVLVGLLCIGFLGLFLTWSFCSGTDVGTESEPAPAKLSPVQPEPEPVKTAAPEPAPLIAKAEPVAMAEVTKAEPATAAPKAAPAKPKSAPKPAAAKASKPRTPVAERPVTEKPSKVRAASPRASGLDAAIGRTKEAAAQQDAPLLLLQPRGGKGDDLKQIVGVGPALERLLNEVGVWHFDQIAAWKARDIAFVDSKMKTFKGRITRDEWVKQARTLARGGKV